MFFISKSYNSGEIDPVQGLKQLPGKVREVGNYAIWSLSSCKPGFGVDQLRDDITETYWQSDGQLPHLVNIQFKRKTTIRDICIYTDYKLDESYTPNRYEYLLLFICLLVLYLLFISLLGNYMQNYYVTYVYEIVKY